MEVKMQKNTNLSRSNVTKLYKNQGRQSIAIYFFNKIKFKMAKRVLEPWT